MTQMFLPVTLEEREFRATCDPDFIGCPLYLAGSVEGRGPLSEKELIEQTTFPATHQKLAPPGPSASERAFFSGNPVVEGFLRPLENKPTSWIPLIFLIVSLLIVFYVFIRYYKKWCGTLITTQIPSQKSDGGKYAELDFMKRLFGKDK